MFSKQLIIAGVESERFVEPVSDELKCPICFCILNPDSVQNDIGNCFCRKCIVDWIEIDNRCPLTRRHLTYKMLKPLKSKLQKEIEELKVQCKYKTYGCNEICTYKYLKDHEINCEFFLDECDFCNTTCSHKTIKNHSCAWVRLMIFLNNNLLEFLFFDWFKLHLLYYYTGATFGPIIMLIIFLSNLTILELLTSKETQANCTSF